MIMANKAEVAKEVKAKLAEEKRAEEKKAEQETKPSPTEKKPAAKKEAPKAEAKKEAPKAEVKKVEEVLEEKILTIPLREAWRAPRKKRAKAAIRILREQFKRHIKKDTKFDISVNKAIWKRSITNPPRKIKVNVKIYKDFARAYLVE
jgi:ribosomal protein L31E